MDVVYDMKPLYLSLTCGICLAFTEDRDQSPQPGLQGHARNLIFYVGLNLRLESKVP